MSQSCNFLTLLFFVPQTYKYLHANKLAEAGFTDEVRLKDVLGVG